MSLFISPPIALVVTNEAYSWSRMPDYTDTLCDQCMDASVSVSNRSHIQWVW